jgi:hypothetical protein
LKKDTLMRRNLFRSSPATRKHSPQTRLGVESLEDRVVPATLWVDNTPGMGGHEFTATGGTQPASVTGLTPGVDIFPTIGAAVAAAAPGDTINVSDGTYSELVNVNKPLTIHGNNFGLDARTRGALNETIVNGQLNGTNRTTSFYINAYKVMLDGFTIRDQSDPNVFGAGIVMSNTTSDVNILDNIITNNAIGLYANGGPSLVQHNLFDANNTHGPAGGAGIYEDQGTNGLTIDANEFRNHTLNNPIIIGATTAGENVNLAVTNNYLHDNVTGIYALSVAGGLFRGNTIRTSPAATALTLAGNDTNVQVVSNDLSNNARGLRIADFGDLAAFGISPTPNSDITVTGNNFANDSEHGLGVIGTAGGGNPVAYTGTLIATQNWWGDISGPTAAGNPGGTGSKIRNDNPSTAPITYSPWATSPDGLITTTGNPGVTFQPDPCDPTKTALVVFGTNDDDHIQIQLKGNNQLEVKIDSKNFKLDQIINLSAVTGHIIVYGLNGNDHIEVQDKVTLPAWLFGGNGDDHIQAGGGDTLEVGGAGDDHLEGGKGRDILIGGTGSDHLEGKDGENILIAGTTDYDNNLSALCSITMTWSGPGTFNQRVTALGSVLSTSTVHDDGVEDQLDGGQGPDWIFANVAGPGVNDKIGGKKSNDLVTDI